LELLAVFCILARQLFLVLLDRSLVVFDALDSDINCFLELLDRERSLVLKALDIVFVEHKLLQHEFVSGQDCAGQCFLVKAVRQWTYSSRLIAQKCPDSRYRRVLTTFLPLRLGGVSIYYMTC
jgi:hypothetical protein